MDNPQSENSSANDLEHGLPHQQASNRALLNSLAMAVCALDERGVITSLNLEAVRLLGWGESVCQGKSFHDLTQCRAVLEDDGIGECPISQVIQSKKTVWVPRARLVCRGDGIRVIEMTCVPLVERGAEGIVLSFRDLALQIQLEDDRQRLASIPEESPFPIVELDINANMLYANPAMTQLMSQVGFREQGFSRALPHDIDQIVKQSLRDAISMQDVEVDVGPKQYAWLFSPIRDLGLVRGYGMDITERKTAAEELGAFVEVLGQKNAELDDALKNAEIATKAKAAFLATMSHEIRTPLNGIIGMTGLLLEGNLTSDQHEDAETIQKSAEGLLTIVNDILDFSKIEAGKLELETIEFDLRELLEDLLDVFGSRAHNKDLALAGLVHPAVPRFVQGDPGRVRQILTNLIGNAIKFTQHGEVVINIETVPDVCEGAHDEKSETYSLEGHRVYVRMTVSDTGIGIDVESRSQLFEAFYQGDVSTTRKFGGTGLGLAISKELVELMGGTIHLTTQLGKGSEFAVTVPLLLGERATEPFPDDFTLKELSNRRVLLIEPHIPTRRGIEMALDLIQATYDGTGNALEGQEWLEKARIQGKPYDIVLLDANVLPRGSASAIRSFQAVAGQGGTLLVLLISKGRREYDFGEVNSPMLLSKPVRRSRLYNCMRIHAGLRNKVPVSPVQSSVAPRGQDSNETVQFVGRILLAEDNPINQRVVMGILQKMGVRVDIASNGQEAVAAVSRQKYDLVFMDWQMPEMDGLQATRLIRLSESKRQTGSEVVPDASGVMLPVRVPIVAMTANAMDGDRDRCLDAGMDDYLPKPIRRDILVDVLHRWLSRARQPELQTFNHGISQNGSCDRSAEGTVMGATHASKDGGPVTSYCNWSMALESIDGDSQLLGELICLFTENAPSMLETIRGALAQKDYLKTSKTAHTIKGAVGAFRAYSVAETADRLERVAEKQDDQECKILCAQLTGEIAGLMQELHTYVSDSTRLSVS